MKLDVIMLWNFTRDSCNLESLACVSKSFSGIYATLFGVGYSLLIDTQSRRNNIKDNINQIHILWMCAFNCSLLTNKVLLKGLAVTTHYLVYIHE